MRDLKLSDFAVGQSYEVEASAGPLPMTLIEAQELQGSPRESGAFRLEFRGPFEPVLEQAIYPVSGPDGARDEIFIVPIAREPDGMRYEAVFF